MLGDHCSDLDAASGVACDSRLAVGILNDNDEAGAEARTATREEYARHWDLVLEGSDASLEPIAALLRARGDMEVCD